MAPHIPSELRYGNPDGVGGARAKTPDVGISGESLHHVAIFYPYRCRILTM